MADYHVLINPDSDFGEGETVYLKIDADDIDGFAMDQEIAWVKVIGVPVVVGHDYHVVINPDADYDFDKPYTSEIDADGDIGYAMDKARSWFRSVADPVPPGNDYHVLINPDADFVSDWPMHLFISAASDAGWSLDEAFSWFRVVKAFFGYHVVIDPDVYLEELTIYDLIIDAINTFTLPFSQSTWFKTGPFGFYTPLTGEWVNLEEDGTVQKGQLQRFLKLISFLLDEVKAKIDSFPVLLNVDKTDADILPLIAALVGVEFSYDLSIPHQREEIKRAVNVYKRKGTIQSIKQFCRSVFGFNPEVSEWPKRIMMFNKPNHLLPKITTPGYLDQGRLAGDPMYYLLDFSESGDYRFDKFGVYFNLAEYAGIPKAGAEKILRLLPKKIPASTQAKLIFVDATYQFGSTEDLSAETFYHAFGTGNESWDHDLPFPPDGQTKLINEIYRRKPDSIVFVDENGKITPTPSGRFRMVTVLRENEPELDGQFLREQGLFAGDATEEKDSGTLLGVVNHKRQWKVTGYRIIKTLELAHDLSFLVDESGNFVVYGNEQFVVG